MKTLVLIPSQLEKDHLLGEAEPSSHHGLLDVFEYAGLTWAVCGVGPAAASLTTGHLIGALKPERVVLAGIGGAYAASGLEPGEIVQARGECFADLGYRGDPGFINLDKMGIPVLAGGNNRLGCRYNLPLLDSAHRSHEFLTVSTITSSTEEAGYLWHTYGAGVENMEGAGAALACAFHQTPLFEIRAISNLVGPRDPSHWLIEGPLRVLKDWLLERLTQCP